MSKKIIFVAGADHSGSTLIGAILGATRTQGEYFHGGEVHAFFKKENSRYGQAKAASKSPGGDIWGHIDHTVGYENAYQEIFEKTNSKIIIDSSKTPMNLKVCLDSCNANAYHIHVVITFRPFAKIWCSDLNRNKKEQKIVQNIMRYQRLKKMVIDQGLPYSILNMESLILNPKELTKALCRETAIPYFEGKEDYWNFPSCHLYGSKTQRKHLKEPKTAGYNIQKVLTPAQTTPSFLVQKNIRAIEAFMQNNALKSQD